jgi:hypothetical protein
MQSHLKRFPLFIHLLTAASTLLATLMSPFDSCSCAASTPLQDNSFVSRSTVEHCPPSFQNCCKLKGNKNAPCCCCPAPQTKSNDPARPCPRITCSICSCSSPSDAVPPALPLSTPDLSGATFGSNASLDLPVSIVVDPNRCSTAHRPPPVADLVISLSRLTC